MNKRKTPEKIEKDLKVASKNRRIFWVRVLTLSLLSILFALTFFISDKIEGFVNFSYNDNVLSTVIEEDGLKIHFINVGQAEAILIEFPNDETMLIDSGHYYSSSQEKFITYLNKIDFKVEGGEKVIDYFVLTHPDSDHIGGAEYIFDNYKINYCCRPDIYSLNESVDNTDLMVQSTSDLYASVIDKMYAEDYLQEPMPTVQELPISSPGYDSDTAETDPLNWVINFYAPIVSELPYRTGDDYQQPIANDYSPIMILSYLDKKIMFTGDVSEDVEEDFMNFYESDVDTDFDVDFLKVAHHGSKNSTCDDFLTFINPEYAIISVGNNSYGHPSEETITRLENYGLSLYDIYRTDLNGNIVVGISSNGEMSLNADYVQYTTFEFKWWLIYIILEFILFIIIFSPYLKYMKIKGRKI